MPLAISHKPYTIGIDINEANVEKRVGSGQYAYHILKYLAAHRGSVHYHLYHRDPLAPDLPESGPGWEYHQVGPVRGWLTLGLPLHLLLSRRHHDVFWSPAHYVPPYLGCPSVVTIHDLAYEYFPELFLPRDRYKLKNWTRAAVAKAAKVIAVSQATADDLVKLYAVPRAKIVVVPNGYDTELFNVQKSTNSSIFTNFQLETCNYILFLGTLQPRKNVIRLVQAFRLLKEQGYKGKLVLAGGIGWLAEETLATIRRSPDHKDIVLTGYVSDDVRRALYQHADVYVLPSLYEGFGVPAIEAMACGAPVAVADNSSLPEVVGEAGALFDAADPADIVRAIREVQADRAAYVKKSLARAQDFSWEKCANATGDVLRSIGKHA